MQERHVAALQSLPEARGPDPRPVRLRGLRDRNVRHAVAQDALRLVEPVRDRLAGLRQGRQPPGDGRAAGFHGRAAIRCRQVQEAHRLERRRAKVCRVRRHLRGRAARIGRRNGPGRLPQVRPQHERSRLPLPAAQRAGNRQAQEGLLAPAREAIPQDRLQAYSQCLARGGIHRPYGPQRRDGHDLAAGTERRFPVPRSPGWHDALHALPGWYGRRVGGPGRSRRPLPGHRHAGPRSGGPPGQGDGSLPAVRWQAGSPQDGAHHAGSALPEGLPP